MSAIVGGGAVMFGVAALGQVGPSSTEEITGTLKTARIISNLEANDNFNLSEDTAGDAVLWTNTLEFGLTNRTDIDLFDATVSGDLRFADLPTIGQDTSLDNGTVNAVYDRQVDDSSFSFRFFYNDADIEFLDPLRTLDDNGAVDDTRGQGRRALTDARFALDLFETGPVSLSLSGSIRDRDYRDTTDPSLVDRRDYQFGVETGLEVASGYRVLFGGTFRSTSDDAGNLDSESTELFTGVLATPTPTTQASFRLGYSELSTEGNDRDTVDEKGTVAQFVLSEDLKNGNVAFLASSRFFESGRRNELSVERSLDTPTGELSGAVGVANTDGIEVRPFVSLFYSRVLPTSELNFSFRQTLDIDDDGNDVLNASLGADYLYIVNPVSSFGINALASNRLQLNDNPTNEDFARVTLEAQYNHLLTRDWQLSTGVRHRSRFEDNNDASSNAVFVTLTRQFAAN